mmetsp:Transcript_24437/g.35040  ORF Transcript_24437/g.35040 Transcript_24437/m.35040 type:complete len:377 (-) Transcript_24437:224-1354(-)|eukprot:CAMPEP_0172430398 /NCGR_PEP_ID=MMETSP1064-20121228/54275_1 /TAXON_ID=202472 /ORGANISM="Aulacoseira subarctica , Strain CCAP 1002/5" /LENGTH=376 /DNA_ID=CAMNT_0013176413 /DNA_START=59 /DNA_END=1189 /DNA_ORIENTATION=-
MATFQKKLKRNKSNGSILVTSTEVGVSKIDDEQIKRERGVMMTEDASSVSLLASATSVVSSNSADATLCNLAIIADARLTEERKQAKRLANRKAASDSRARKRAHIESLTQTNAVLRRYAEILSALPDLVLAMDEAGVISFCSTRLLRFLGRTADELLGANIDGIALPASSEPIRRLVQNLVLGADTFKNGTTQETKNIRRQGNDNTLPPLEETPFKNNEEAKLRINRDKSEGLTTILSSDIRNVVNRFPLTNEFPEQNREITDIKSEDSGYGASIESSLSPDDFFVSSNSKLAPTYNVCLVKKDRSLIWCEATASITNLDSEWKEITITKQEPNGDMHNNTTHAGNAMKRETRQILLSLRPLRCVADKARPSKRL